MEKHILVIREADGIVFEAIKNGTKTIETRAATDKYRKVKEGDILIFVCSGERLEKQIIKVEYFQGIDEMVKVIDFKKVMPFVNSVEEMKQVYFSFPNYEEKISQFGLAVFYLKC